MFEGGEDASIPEGASLVMIMDCVSPGEFWARTPPKKDPSEDQIQLIQMEHILSQYFHRNPQISSDTTYRPHEGDMVAVYFEDKHARRNKGRWHRGKVSWIGQTVKGFRYSIFLVDLGLQVQVFAPHIRRLPLELCQLKHQAFQVKLYGMFPVAGEMDYFDEMKMKYEISANWSSFAHKHVQELLKEASSIYLLKRVKEKDIIYGFLYLKFLDQKVCILHEELIKKQLGVLNEDKYLKEVLSDDSTEESVPVSVLPETPIMKIPKLSSPESRPSKVGHRYIGDYNNEYKRQKDHQRKTRAMLDSLRKHDPGNRSSEESSVDSYDDVKKPKKFAGRGESLKHLKEKSKEQTNQGTNSIEAQNGAIPKLPSKASPELLGGKIPIGRGRGLLQALELVTLRSKSSLLPLRRNSRQSDGLCSSDSGTSNVAVKDKVEKKELPTVPLDHKESNTRSEINNNTENSKLVQWDKLKSEINDMRQRVQYIPAGISLNLQHKQSDIESCDRPKKSAEYAPTNLIKSPKEKKTNSLIMHNFTPNYAQLYNLGPQTIERDTTSSKESKSENHVPQCGDASSSQTSVTKKCRVDDIYSVWNKIVEKSNKTNKPQIVNVKSDDTAIVEHNKQNAQDGGKQQEVSVECDDTVIVEQKQNVHCEKQQKVSVERDITVIVEQKQNSHGEKQQKASVESDDTVIVEHKQNAQHGEKQIKSIENLLDESLKFYMERKNASRADQSSLTSKNSNLNSDLKKQVQCSNNHCEQATVVDKSEARCEGVSCPKFPLPSNLANLPIQKTVPHPPKTRSIKSSSGESSGESSHSSLRNEILHKAAKKQVEQNQTILTSIKQSVVSPAMLPVTKNRLPKCAIDSLSSSASSDTDSQQEVREKISSICTYESVLPTLKLNDQKSRLELRVGQRIMEQKRMTRVLVHGNNLTKPYHSIAQAPFPAEIHKMLGECGFTDLTALQSVVWPIVFRRQSVICVSPTHSGKTYSYLVPLVSFMYWVDEYSEFPPEYANGPLALILCSSSNGAQEIYNITKELLGPKKDVKVVLAYGGGAEKDEMYQLIKGCHILITTPKCFLRFLDLGTHVTNLYRTCHLVLEDADILTSKFVSEVKAILKACQQTALYKAKHEMALQVITVAEKWTVSLKSFAENIVEDPVICIGSFLEALVYSKLVPRLHFIGPKGKIDRLLGILEGVYPLYKTVIMCNTASTVEYIVPFLQNQCYQTFCAHSKMTTYDVKEVGLKWHASNVPGNYPILVCDDVLPDLDIKDATCLIHYDLPDESKTQFGFRFTCLMDHYPSILDKDEDKKNLDVLIHVLVEQDNMVQLPTIIALTKRMGVAVSPEIEALAIEAVRQKEKEKRKAPLCYNVKAFGLCYDKHTCPGRHLVLSEVDKPDKLATCGEVKIKVLALHDACHYSARITEHTDLDGNVSQLSDDYCDIQMALIKHFTNEHNKVTHINPAVGDICAVESSTALNCFARVQIVAYTARDAMRVTDVLVKHLEDGVLTEVKTYQLMALPEELQKRPPQVIEVFLCGLKPCDMDRNFGWAAKQQVSEWIEEANHGLNEFIVGKIKLSLGSTLWLDPLDCYVCHSVTGTASIKYSIRANMLAHGLAEENPSHLETLYALCKQVDLDLPDYSAPVKKAVRTSQRVTPQWSFLPADDFVRIVVNIVDTPHNFFVQRNKWLDRIQVLTDEIQKWIATSNPQEEVGLEVGALCLAKYPDEDTYYRARIFELSENKESEVPLKDVMVYFVDHGDLKIVSEKDLRIIPDKFITKLPFQAIECSLVGVKPLEGGKWSIESGDFFHNFCREEEEDDYLKTMLGKVCRYTTPKYSGGKKYEVILYDTNSSEDILVNKLLIEKGFAVCVEEDNAFVEQPLVVPPDSSSPEYWSTDSDTTNSEAGTLSVPYSTFQSVPKKTDTEGNASDADVSEIDEDGYDVVISDPRQFLRNMLNMSKAPEAKPRRPAIKAAPKTHSGKSSTSSHSEEEAQSSYSSAYSDYSDLDEEYIPDVISNGLTPKVLWSQDEETVRLEVKIIGVASYSLRCSHRSLLFSTTVNENFYYLNIQLFGAIDPQCVDHEAHGLDVTIKMKKCLVGVKWLQLLRNNRKTPWLSANFEHIARNECDSEGEGEKSKLNIERVNEILDNNIPIQEKYSGVHILPEGVADTDESESDEPDPHTGDEPFDPYNPFA